MSELTDQLRALYEKFVERGVMTPEELEAAKIRLEKLSESAHRVDAGIEELKRQGHIK